MHFLELCLRGANPSAVFGCNQRLWVWNWREMTLAYGVRLGPYEILDALGAGGMGEVYRARDTRLGRTVAIKILPARFSSDPSRTFPLGHL
jgi:serine/threonine protein kinase